MPAAHRLIATVSALLLPVAMCAAAVGASAAPVAVVDVTGSHPSLRAALSTYDFSTDIDSFIDDLYGWHLLGARGVIAEKQHVGPGQYSETVTAYFALQMDPNTGLADPIDPTLPFGTFTTTPVMNSVIDVDPGVAADLAGQTFSADPFTYFSEREAFLGYPLVGKAGTLVDWSIIARIGIGDPESPDFIVIHTDYLIATTEITELHTVPEPSSVAMLMLGGAVLGGFAWRRSRFKLNGRRRSDHEAA